MSIRKKVAYGALALGILIAAATIYSKFSAKQAELKFRQDVAAIHAMGVPITWDELSKNPNPPEENAETAYRKYMKALDNLSPSLKQQYADLCAYRPTSTAAKLTLEGEHLNALIALLQEGAEKPVWYAGSHFQADDEITVYSIGVRLFVNLALAEDKNALTNKAPDHLRSAMLLCSQRTPFLHAERSVVEAYEKVLAHHRRNAGVIERILNDFKAAARPIEFQHFLYSELLTDIDGALGSNPHDYQLDNPTPWLKFRWKYWDARRYKRARMADVGLWRNALTKISNPYDWTAVNTALTATYDAFPNKSLFADFDSGLRSAGWETNFQGETIARRKLVVIAATLLLEEAKSGSLPKTLSNFPASANSMALSDLGPIDPYSGKSLIYKLTPTGFTLYSVGRDRVDNGGLIRTRGARVYDLVFSI